MSHRTCGKCGREYDDNASHDHECMDGEEMEQAIRDLTARLEAAEAELAKYLRKRNREFEALQRRVAELEQRVGRGEDDGK